MTFSEKVSLGHTAIKNGWSLVRNNKNIIWCGVLTFLPVMSFSMYISHHIAVATRLSSDVSTCFLCTIPWGLMLAQLLLFVVLQWLSAGFLNFLLKRSKNQPASVWHCFTFDHTTGWQIIVLGCLYAALNVPTLILGFTHSTGLILIWSLLNSIVGVILYVGLLVIVDQTPGVWMAIKRGAAFLWNNMLSVLVLYGEIIGIFILLFGVIVVTGVLLARLFSAEFFQITSLFSGSPEAFTTLAAHSGLLALLIFFGVILLVGFLFVMFIPMAAFVSLYNARKR